MVLLHPSITMSLGGIWRLQKLVILAEYMLGLFLFLLGLSMSQGSRFGNFCYGQVYNPTDSHKIKSFIYSSIFQGLTFSKTSMYIIIFLKIYYKNKADVGLTQKVMQKRRKTNAITVTGEMAAFIVSFIIYATFQVLHSQRLGWDWLAPEAGG